MNIIFKYARHAHVNGTCGSPEMTGMAYWTDPIIKGKDGSQEHCRLNTAPCNYYSWNFYSNRNSALMMWNMVSFQYQTLETSVFGRLESHLLLLHILRLSLHFWYNSKSREFRDFYREEMQMLILHHIADFLCLSFSRLAS